MNPKQQAAPDADLAEKSIEETIVRLDNVFDLMTKDKIKDASTIKIQNHALLYAGFLTDVKNKAIAINEQSMTLVKTINDFCALIEQAQ